MWIETATWQEKQEFSHLEWPTNPAEKGAIAVHGEDVWNPKTLEMSDKNGEKKENPLLKVPTLEEMTLEKDLAKQKLGEAAKKNPDWPPAAENPEAEKRLSGDLEAGMNRVV